ncbi:hypothetical protein DSL72_004666 [Monilinia vaccinii-corymbosi]|uniref:DUF7905 domain-containing protein n=1 Tax=Monilinia vaccinii-corymbosi TaxID=61207 RepID=A0A8A3P4D2_9HELO|nr:hypothetical protein DSL72_004666 [Monilinia vaccinii-corymbosi]
MYNNKIATFESHTAAAWDAESEIGDVEEVHTSANVPAGVRPPLVQRDLFRTHQPVQGSGNGGRGQGRGTTGGVRGRGADGGARGQGRGADRNTGRDGSHRGGRVTQGNLSGNAGRGGHHAGRGNGRLFESAPRGGHFRDGTGPSAVPSTNNRADHESPRRPVVRAREAGVSSTGWAKPTPLLTNARKEQLRIEDASLSNIKRFLKKPVDEEVFSAMGFYQWPMKEDSPEDLFGPQLKDLDHLKTSCRVYIDWKGSCNLLRIRAPLPSGQVEIIEAMKGIRQAIGSARARATMAATVYVVVPPQHSIDSTLLVALSDQFPRSDGQKHVHSIKFSKKSSEEELKKQNASRSSKTHSSVEKFRTDLSKSLNELKHLKDRMQMRIHFGELHLTHWRTDLTDGKQSFEDFTKMMKRARTRGVFEKGIDPRVVKYMMDKVRLYPEKFRVWNAVDLSLSDVQPKHVAIFTVQNSAGEIFQIEADIDKTDGGYQCGSVKVIEEERRNTCVEIVTIDIERVDWNIEVISETAGTIINSSFQDLVESCLQPFVRTGLNAQQLEERRDKYDFTYPKIAPRSQPGLRVDKVRLQSIYRFKTATGGYCLEFTINRDWIGLSTVGEPEVSAGVAMFHDQWDTEMESNEYSTADRNWQKDMSNFFPIGGFEVFMQQLDYLLNGLHMSKSYSTL